MMPGSEYGWYQKEEEEEQSKTLGTFSLVSSIPVVATDYTVSVALEYKLHPHNFGRAHKSMKSPYTKVTMTTL